MQTHPPFRNMDLMQTFLNDMSVRKNPGLAKLFMEGQKAASKKRPLDEPEPAPPPKRTRVRGSCHLSLTVAQLNLGLIG